MRRIVAPGLVCLRADFLSGVAPPDRWGENLMRREERERAGD
jgi:hypothetical protein